jgi:hypothetical protein
MRVERNDIEPIKSQITMIFLFVLFLCALVLIRLNAAQASPETVVEVVPYASSANVSQTFTVNVTIVDVQNLYGLDARVYWNSSILEAVNIDVRLGQADGVLYNSPYPIENSTQPGTYAIAATSTPPAPSFNGSGNIVRITFKVTGPGYSNLDLETQLSDYPPPDREPRVSLPIQHTTIGGHFSMIIPEIPGSAILVAFMILTASTLLFSKMRKKCA